MSALSSDALGGMNGAALGGGAALAGGLVAMTGRVGQLALRGITTYMRRKYLCKLETRDSLQFDDYSKHLFTVLFCNYLYSLEPARGKIQIILFVVSSYNHHKKNDF